MKGERSHLEGSPGTRIEERHLVDLSSGSSGGVRMELRLIVLVCR